MQRNLQRLAAEPYDLAVIGGGIYGACIAWDAVLRGLSVALVEKSDFASATSANSLKIIHGGLRQLQYGAFKQMRAAIHERAAFMRIAPQLVHPLPVVIPTYGHSLQGKALLSLALRVNDVMGFDRNHLEDPEKHISEGRTIGRAECLSLFPGIRERGLTGGALFYDGQIYNSERLVLAFLRSAAGAGAALANYVEVIGLLKKGARIGGVKVRDRLSGDLFEIRSGVVVNAAGPWSGFIPGAPPARFSLAKAINVVSRPIFEKHAVGLSGNNGYAGAGALSTKRAPFFFVVPWRGRSLLGTAYSFYDGDPDNCRVSASDIEKFLEHFDRACPGTKLTLDDVSFVHGGLLPANPMGPRNGAVRLWKDHAIYDHASEGAPGLLSAVGVKYTMARYVAEKLVDRIFVSRGQRGAKSTSSVVPLYGGKIARFESFLDSTVAAEGPRIGKDAARGLVYNYGSSYREIFNYLGDFRQDGGSNANSRAILRAQITHGIKEEMAQKLSDVVFRRTELGTAGYPGPDALHVCAEAMSTELGWNSQRTRQELQEVYDIYGERH